MEERLKRRKLDALRRGVHRVAADQTLLVSTHVVGIGKAGAGVIAEILRTLAPDALKFTALAIDIGARDLAELRALAASLPPERATLQVVELDVPTPDVLADAWRHYPERLTLEYPGYRWGEDWQPWLTPSEPMAAASDHVPRAVAKAIYGLAYYAPPRTMHLALREFARGVEASGSQAIVAIVFGLAGGAGSGIAVDLARHLSIGAFGRAVLVAGIGIAPCDGDAPAHLGAGLYPALNELDCLGDETKSAGVVASCGELFRNPFTAGFIVVPQSHAWDATRDLAATQSRANREIATLLTANAGANLWETLRLLNWVAAPSTQHSAARTPWGPKWIHMLGYADEPGGQIAAGPDLARRMGLRGDYAPEFIEVRVADPADAGAEQWVARLSDAFAPDVPPQVVGGARQGSAQWILPCVAKTDLRAFFEARDVYDDADMDQRRLAHAMLLEQGIVLSEPSTRLAGMAGASLRGGRSWVAVDLDSLRGPEPAAPARPVRELHAVGEPV